MNTIAKPEVTRLTGQQNANRVLLTYHQARSEKCAVRGGGCFEKPLEAIDSRRAKPQVSNIF